MFPCVVEDIIMNYVSNYEFLSWICKDKINNHELSYLCIKFRILVVDL